MSTFNKDDYLNDLPDPEDVASHASSSGPADQGSPDSDPGSGASSPQPESSASDPSGARGVPSDDAPAAAEGAHGASTDGDLHAASDDGADSDAAKASGDGDTLTPLGQAKKEAAEYLDALQRERAEFVNFRNRSKKEQDLFRQHGVIDVLSALLPALDDIDRIREHNGLDDSFTAVAAKIDKTFAKFGVEKFGEPGETFDPTKHEAVLHKPVSDATEETVDTVVEAGYRIGDRVIRAARVVVASPKS